MQFFQDLGSLVEQHWRDKDYNEEVFPEVAAEALATMAPSEKVDPWDIIRWLNKTTQLAPQRDVEGAFGNPPITLYDGPRFYIDVYYWLDGTTSVHQHSFSGAFQVLLGSSILSQYDFEEQRRINAHFSVGKMTLNNVELLAQGDIRRIYPGRQYIHSLFHLDRPSASVVIRTHQSPSGIPQYDYHMPFLAINPFFKDPTMIKRVQSAALLLQMNHPDADSLIGEALSSSDFQTAFSLLDLSFNFLSYNYIERTFGLDTGKERFEALVEIARRRHGDLVDIIKPVFDEAQRKTYIVNRRGQVINNEHRFFLALLLNVSDRMKVIDLVKKRFPGQDPIDTIIDWVDELASTKIAGSSETNVLGINNYGEDYLFVLRGLLEGHTLNQIQNGFAEEASAEEAANIATKLEDLYHTIRTSILFKSIFLDTPSTLNDNCHSSLNYHLEVI